MNKFIKVMSFGCASAALALAATSSLTSTIIKPLETKADTGKVTLAYTGNTTSNLGTENSATTLGLSASDWSAIADKGSATNNVGVNSAGDFRLYYNANGSNTLTVTSLNDWTITTIDITYTGINYKNGKVLVGGNVSADTDGNNADAKSTHTISATSFVLTNGNTSNVQVRVSSIVINYDTGSGSGSSEPPATTYTVTYNANGGTGTLTDPNSPYAENAEVTVLDNGFERAGYNFVNWNTSADGKGTDYDPEDTFEITANTTLYAQWEEDVSPEVFPAGEAFTATMTLGTNGYDATVNNKTAVKVGTGSKGGDMTITAGEGATAVTFRAAAWNGVDGLSLNISGVTSTPAKVDLTSDTGLSGSSSAFTLSSSERVYLFTITFNELAEDTEITLTSSIAKRFVVWDAKYYINDTSEKFTISYNANGGEGSMANTVAANPIVAESTFTAPEGKVFAKWNTANDGSGDDYAPGDTPAQNLTLYAIWATEVGGNVTMLPGSNSSSATVNSKDAVKCGTGSKKGVMSLTLKAAEISKIKLYVAGWSSDSNKTVNVSISEGTISPASITVTSDSGISNNSPFTLSTNNLANFKKVFTISNAPENATITLEADQASNNRYVVWGATDLFAETFANQFNSNLTCDASGVNQPSYKNDYSWASFKSLYSNLDTEEQGILHDATADKDSDDPIKTSMARYDYIVGKYNVKLGMTTAYPDFIDRKPSAPAGLNVSFNPMTNQGDHTTLALIITVSALSLLTMGGFLLLRRKAN